MAWRCFREGKREGRARGFYRHEQGKNSSPKSSGIKSGRNLRSDAVTGEKSGWRKKTTVTWRCGPHLSARGSERLVTVREKSGWAVGCLSCWAERDAPRPFSIFFSFSFFDFHFFLIFS
jgi:hypothetical protein